MNGIRWQSIFWYPVRREEDRVIWHQTTILYIYISRSVRVVLKQYNITAASFVLSYS